MVDPNWEFVTAVPAAGYRLAYIPGELRERDAYPVLAFLLFKMNPDVGFSFSPDKLVPVTSEGPHWTDEPYVLIRADGTVEKHGDDFAIYPSIVEYNNKSRRASGKGHKHGPLLLRLRPACIGSLTPMAPANREGPNMTDAKHLPAGIHAAGIHSAGYSGYLHRRHAQRIMTEIALAEAEKSIPAIVRNELRRLRERNASLRAEIRRIGDMLYDHIGIDG